MSGTSGEHRFRERGDIVMYRYVGLGQTFVANAATVDHDDVRSTGVYIAPGTPERQIRVADGSFVPRVIPPGYFERVPVAMQEGVFGGGQTLIVWQPGRAHAVHVHWREPDWAPVWFYVNLQTPMMETPTGFDTTDQFLDIVVDADLNWHWKDEDELEEAVGVGRLTVAEAEAVRIEGEHVVADIEARRWSFDGSYDEWRPDPSWPVPPMPDDWESE